jgi:hypothetical protein
VGEEHLAVCVALLPYEDADAPKPAPKKGSTYGATIAPGAADGQAIYGNDAAVTAAGPGGDSEFVQNDQKIITLRI